MSLNLAEKVSGNVQVSEQLNIQKDTLDILEKSSNKKLLWKNRAGIEIDLNDSVAVNKELENEKLRYRLYLQSRFITEAELYLSMTPVEQANYTTLMQKLKNRAKQKETSFATELNYTIYKHMEAYRGKLKKIKNKLDAGSVKDTGNIWWHKTTAYDMSTESGAQAYIQRRATNHIGEAHTPERLKARLVLLSKEIIPKLENNGYDQIANKLNLYIEDLIIKLDQGIIPEALHQVKKRPTVIKQVRNKNYDISDKYAFGTYLSFSYRDILTQNPSLSEDEARILLCRQVIADLQNEAPNPTITTDIQYLEIIIDSPVKFYELIHAKRLASIRSAEKRKLKRQQNK